jgi:tetratricopeptide (TPR) repeat protein
MSHGTAAANPEKGARYLALLDQALCNASWSEVPELARKVEKHAPTRRCLTLAARSEAQIASASHRPTSASSNPTASLHGLSDLIPRLEEAIVVGNSIEEDAFIASVGLAEIHWLREDKETALKLLPDFVPESNTHSSLPSAVGWMEVCAIKTAFIRAASLESQGKEAEARKLYQEAIGRTPGARSTELRKWTERLLARACMHFNAQTSSRSTPSLTEALRAFTVWNDFWQRAQSNTTASGDSASRIDIPRRQVWRAYYNLLSSMLQDGLAYYMASDGRIHIGSIHTFPENFRTSSKQSQRADLKRVESTYESLLIQETQFPKASQTNLEVEQWVEQAMKNWRIISGFGWTDAELGQGGKEGVSRTMLDILYRAATKTFHSTAVLRELFNVHASLGEFDLAMHAFDSYIDIIGKGKARAQKTGHHQDGIDDDDTAVLTGVEAVRVLCRYGDLSQAEKAVAVGKNLQRWLGEGRPQSSEQTTANGEQAATPNHQTTAQLKPSTLAAAYRAIGISQAQHARLTYDTDARPTLQAEALKQLRRAEAQEPDNIETCFALSSLLAETRDVNSAIVSIRRILAAKPDDRSDGQDDGVKDYTRQRKLVPLWHLLALCLSAKDQHEAAYKMCEAALEQFGDKTVLFGKAASLSGNIEKRSDAPRSPSGLVDQMDSFEKETIVQIKMTELALTELTEGPSTAVDMTDELLGLYARLFGKPEETKETKAPKALPAVPAATPTRTGGTLRSIAGSIRPRTNRNSIERSRPRGATLELPTGNGQANTTSGQDLGPPIAITITNEDGTQADRGRGRQEHRHLPFKLRNSMAASRSRSRSLGGKSRPLPNENDQPPLPPPKDYPAGNATADQKPVTSAINTNQTSPQQPLKTMAHNNGHADWPAPAGHNEQPPQQDVRLPVPHPASGTAPVPSFSLAQQKRHKVSVLIKVWLFIAELYVRAESLDDAAGAIQEAHKLVESFEAEVAAVESSARAFYSKTWGGGNSVDELWADVLSSVSSPRHSPWRKFR